MCTNRKYLHAYGVSEDINPVTEQRGYKIDMPITCGYCEECQHQKAMVLAMKVTKHFEYTKRSGCCLHLTYNDSHLPPFGLEPNDPVKFIKRLRKRYGDKFIYVTSGEYGLTRTHRPHYHILLDLYPSDLKPYGLSKRNYDLYTSRTISSLWPHGHAWASLCDTEIVQYIALHNSVNDKLKYRDLDLIERRHKTLLTKHGIAALEAVLPDEKERRTLAKLKYFEDQAEYLITHPKHRRVAEFTHYSKNIGYSWFASQPFDKKYLTPFIIFGDNQVTPIPREWVRKEIKDGTSYALDYARKRLLDMEQFKIPESLLPDINRQQKIKEQLRWQNYHLDRISDL